MLTCRCFSGNPIFLDYLFKIFDTSGDGYLDVSEINDAMRQLLKSKEVHSAKHAKSFISDQERKVEAARAVAATALDAFRSSKGYSAVSNSGATAGRATPGRATAGRATPGRSP